MLEAEATSAELGERADRIASLEKEGDELSFDLHQETRTGALVAGLADEYTGLVDEVERVLDTCHFAAREIQRASKNEVIMSSEERKEVYRECVKLAEFGRESLSYLREIVSATERAPGTSLDLVEAVDKKEDEADDLKEEIYDHIYVSLDRDDWLLFNHLKTLVHQLDEISDIAEDAAKNVQVVVQLLS